MLTSRDDTGSIVRKPSGKASEVPVFVSCHPATTAHNIFLYYHLFYYAVLLLLKSVLCFQVLARKQQVKRERKRFPTSYLPQWLHLNILLILQSTQKYLLVTNCIFMCLHKLHSFSRGYSFMSRSFFVTRVTANLEISVSKFGFTSGHGKMVLGTICLLKTKHKMTDCNLLYWNNITGPYERANTPLKG